MQLQVQQNISLKNLCTYGTGGAAKYFATSKNPQDMFRLREFSRSQDIPFMILGGGSNVLFSDKGYPGLIIHNQMTKMHIQGDVVTVESGVSLGKMVLIAAQHNLGGISALATIPGTIGGAVYGNAGIPEIYISDILTHAVVLPASSDKPVIVGPEYFQFGYRHSKLKKSKDIVLSATLKLNREPGLKVRADINNFSKNRSLKQPIGRSCGSFFKNSGQFPSAGWLIEQAGCKGMKVGGAVVSNKHANFIMNTGQAKSSDILNLAVKVHQKVEKKFNISLVPEVQILPDSPFKND